MKLPRLATAMTPFPYSVNVGDKVEDAMDLMNDHGIRHVPVTDGAEVVGIVTDRDVKAAQRLLPDLKDYPVETVAETEPFVTDIETRLDEVLLVMVERQIGSAIVTRKGRLAGVFTSVDACAAMAELLNQHYARGDAPGDAA